MRYSIELRAVRRLLENVKRYLTALGVVGSLFGEL